MTTLTDLEAFSPEYEGLFAKLHAHVADGEGPTDEELLCVVKWKLGRITGQHFKMVGQHGGQIRQGLLEAGITGANRNEAITAMIQVPGVKMALASAFLTACWPSQFTVLDWRALRELKEAGCSRPPWPVKSEMWADDVDGYLSRYLPAVEQFQRAKEIATLREADRVLWGRSVRRQICEGLGLPL